MNDRRLPDGKQCGDCQSFEECKATFRQAAFCTTCCWDPCAFKDKDPLRSQYFDLGMMHHFG
jgi:hypothetical protein